MFLRHVKWVAASLAAVAAICLAPARSEAGIQILVEELNGSGTVIASQTTPLGAPGSAPTFNGVYFTGQAAVSSNSGSASTVASLVPSFNGQLLPAFDVTQNHMLRVTVTDTGFIPNGPNGTLKVQVSGSNGFFNGSESIVEETRVFDPLTSQTIAVVPTLFSADGTLQKDQISVTGLTNTYAIQQTLTISFAGNIPETATFGSTGGASIQSNPVPAPGGLALALIGLPLIGARRVLRKRTAA